MNIYKMHNYIWGWAGFQMVFAATFPVAMIRISGTQQFAQQPFSSKNCAGSNSSNRAVTSFWQCAQLKVSPLKLNK
jgi:hypothetical protein